MQNNLKTIKKHEMKQFKFLNSKFVRCGSYPLYKSTYTHKTRDLLTLESRVDKFHTQGWTEKKANTAREALKRDANYTNASDDEKTGNSVNQLKRIGAYNNQWRHKLLLIQYESYCISGQNFWSGWRWNSWYLQ